MNNIAISEESYTQDLFLQNRKISTPSSTFDMIRQQLSINIGAEQTRSLLFQLGREMGVYDAQNMMQINDSLEYLIKNGPLLHIDNGHIQGIKHDCRVQFDKNNNVVSVVGQGVWIGSFEATEHIERLGVSKTPVCYTLTGYASGFMSTVFKQPLIAKELTCTGKGDKECKWIIKTKKQWEQEGIEELPFYNEMHLAEELKYTYDQLLEQKNLITRLATFQKNITEEVINGSDLQSIVNIVHGTLNIPIIVESADARTVTYSGLSEEQYMKLNADMEQYLQENDVQNIFDCNKPVTFRRKMIKTFQQKRLLAPILVQREVLGWCSFIYTDMDCQWQEEDYLFLDSFSNSVSLILLNEKAKFESFERMKGSFLEQILDSTLPESELIKRGRYTGVDLSKPYYITVMEYKNMSDLIEEEFLLQEQIFEMTFRYFNEQKQNILVGHRDGKMVLFIPNEHVKTTINDVIDSLYHYLMKKNPQGHFKFGISDMNDKISNAPKCYEEATIALRLMRKKTIAQFQSLGIIGVLINQQNIDSIKMIAKQELGSLYDVNNPKTLELLKTLYIFLVNRGNLEHTRRDLSLSMSGLRHRINKIEDILQKDLRDSNESNQLLLIIKSLIVLEELPIE